MQEDSLTLLSRLPTASVGLQGAVVTMALSSLAVNAVRRRIAASG